jgi:hypothetical protein
LVCSIFIDNRSLATGEPQQTAAQPPTVAAQSAEKTVDQVRKNIQVLKGLPDSQLIPVMNLMASSLGVRCTYCHVNKEGQWDFATDEKAEKKTAREMIRMVQGINKTTFNGALEVSCYTCHRGRTGPVGVVQLPVAEAPAPPPRPEAGGAPESALPTPDQVLEKYLDAVGGAAAIDKMKTRSMKGTYESNGRSMPFEVYQTAPEKFYWVVTTPQGSFEKGFDGTVGWEKRGQGVREVQGQELSDLKRSGQMFRDLKLKEQFSRVGGRVFKDKIDGRNVYVVRAATPDKRGERLFFDVETGLLVRRFTTSETIIGFIPEQLDYDDYRDVDGVKLPFTIRISSTDPNSSGTRKISEMKLNGPVDESKFSKPAK